MKITGFVGGFCFAMTMNPTASTLAVCRCCGGNRDGGENKNSQANRHMCLACLQFVDEMFSNKPSLWILKQPQAALLKSATAMPFNL